MNYLPTFRIGGLTLPSSDSLRQTDPRFDDDHNAVDLSRLMKTIARWDPEKGPPLDTLLERHRQKLIKRAKGEGAPPPVYTSDRNIYKCLDCEPYPMEMGRNMFQWHALTK